MTGVAGGPASPLDGWAPLIDAAYMRGNRANSGSTFTCPEMVNVEGMRDGQTGTDSNNPKGLDWPNIRNGTENLPTILPRRGLERIIRTFERGRSKVLTSLRWIQGSRAWRAS
jgi:hypothetical protein